MVTNYQGAPLHTNSYDEYGIPDTATGDDIATKGRFRYTGQVWIPELGMYYYKARIYSPTLGRFIQTDPIGYEDQFNLYAYVGNDPVNGVDPTGMDSYMVARQLDSAVGKAGIGHAYIVVDAKYPGDPNAKVISFGELSNGNMGNVNDPSRASDFSKTAHAADQTHWDSLTKDDAGSFSQIDAKDSTVSAVAGAVLETGDYDIIPGADLFGGAPAVNSNSAAMGVAERSTSISRGEPARAPTDYALPGVNESGRVQFNEAKICASDGIKCQ
ncbi:RHS repeat-associated core domain-containing protein [Erythrobacter aureus]|uniref:RHS repeat-associated core domain-containing protein n=2 Tax=Erythrobacter aureus TaxID=2182384 RepID=A0A345YI01_9SPHN|nr:RHS repeat-associated core domain-containing protein [Erythrobacter aureus]